MQECAKYAYTFSLVFIFYPLLYFKFRNIKGIHMNIQTFWATTVLHMVLKSVITHFPKYPTPDASKQKSMSFMYIIFICSCFVLYLPMLAWYQNLPSQIISLKSEARYFFINSKQKRQSFLQKSLKIQSDWYRKYKNIWLAQNLEEPWYC